MEQQIKPMPGIVASIMALHKEILNEAFPKNLPKNFNVQEALKKSVLKRKDQYDELLKNSNMKQYVEYNLQGDEAIATYNADEVDLGEELSALWTEFVHSMHRTYEKYKHLPPAFYGQLVTNFLYFLHGMTAILLQKKDLKG